MRMTLGVTAFDADAGRNPERYFQIDRERTRYLEAKRRIDPARHYRSPEHGELHDHVIAWMGQQLQREHPELAAQTELGSYEGVARAVQEDFVVMGRLEGPTPRPSNAAIAVHVCFPSGWRPEDIRERNLAWIHRTVPDLNRSHATDIPGLLFGPRPLERFVWTVTTDDVLDHHPDTRRLRTVARGDPLWLRVERQLVVPFPGTAASLFLIRTYLYAFDTVTEPAEREHLALVLETDREDIWAYKGLDAAVRREAIRQLRTTS